MAVEERSGWQDEHGRPRQEATSRSSNLNIPSHLPRAVSKIPEQSPSVLPMTGRRIHVGRGSVQANQIYKRGVGVRY